MKIIFLLVAKTARRLNWKASNPANVTRMVPLKHPVKNVLLVDTEFISDCTCLVNCSEVLQGIQGRDFELGYNDIQYNFMMSQDGDLYEGRGWDVSVDDLGMMNETVIVGLFGVSRSDKVEASLQTFKNDGVVLKKLSESNRVEPWISTSTKPTVEPSISTSMKSTFEPSSTKVIPRDEWKPDWSFESLPLKSPIQRVIVSDCGVDYWVDRNCSTKVR